MPTVPSACVPSFSGDDGLVVPVGVQISADFDHSPTPDPEFDDVVLVPSTSAVSTTSSAEPPAHVQPASDARSIKPRLSLADLHLHSPSSIVGTPFDVTPRFEYPFPTSESLPSDGHLSSLYAFTSPLSFYPSMPSMSIASTLPQVAIPLPQVRDAPSRHPKHHLREPPMPPSLAKKKWTCGPPHTHGRPRGASAGDESELVARPKQERVPSDKRAGLDRRRSSDVTAVGDVSVHVEEHTERTRLALERTSSEVTAVEAVTRSDIEVEVLVKPAASPEAVPPPDPDVLSEATPTLAAQEGPLSASVEPASES